MTATPTIFLGAEIGEGASDSGCKFGAAALKESGVVQVLEAAGVPAQWGATVQADAATATSRLDLVERFTPQLAHAVEAVLRRRERPVVVGGDHSCAIGTWSAVAEVMRPAGRIGLVWVDAHLDAHTPESSDSGAPHGMPVAALLGHGSAALTGLYGWAGKLQPQHLAIVGARSFEPAEAALLQRLGVRVFYMDEVQRRGFATCFAEAAAIARRAGAGWGISFDLDALDPRDAPGTGTPVEQGIRLADATAALRTVADDTELRAFELTEYNPLRDFGGVTARAAHAVLAAALAPVRITAECS